MRCPDCVEFLCKYDIVGIQESKTENTDNIRLTGYTCILNNRHKLSRYKSGGIALLVKNSISNYVDIETQPFSKLILWCTISHKITCLKDDIHCGVVYIPPQGSKYAHEEPYVELEQKILRYCCYSKYVILLGDFNSRVGLMDDYLKIDSYISKTFGLEELSDEFSEMIYNFETNAVPLNRQNDDQVTNNYGNMMIDFCKNTNLLILNGRLGNVKNNKQVTCKERSTVDYFLCTSGLFDVLQNLEVCNFDHLFSDAHSPLTVDLNIDSINRSRHENFSGLEPEKIKLWDASKSQLFSENIDVESVTNIDEQLSSLLHGTEITQSDIDSIVQHIGTIFEKTSKASFGYASRKQSTVNHDKNTKPWFNKECRNTRNLYHQTPKMYNKNKTEQNKIRLKQVSKEYKNTIYKSQKQYKNNHINKLRNLKNSNPREYWRILNANQPKATVKATLEDLYNCFKDVNEFQHENDNPCTSQTAYDETEFVINEQINEPITESEVSTAIKNLHSNKSPGHNNIKNEHIKSTAHIMLPIYCKLFNIIFDTGIIPDAWSLDTIKPIYKNKGDPKLPENYRPITILSCLGKLFTSIINNRLKRYAEEKDLIDNCQAGFRKNHSTTDNIFIINSLIDIVKSSKKKLHCCFFDFKQAFDRVSRERLWEKLEQHRINGKCLRLIQNMYQNIKSNVHANNQSSAYFPCYSGVRQGKNLSPFLFTVLINDFRSFLDRYALRGVDCDINYEEITSYFKILILLFC